MTHRKPPVPRLQRPLHRARGRPRTAPPILGTEELKRLFRCSKAQLKDELTLHGIDYHIDSRGEFWAAAPSPGPDPHDQTP
ncbi:MAG: hypothetical protein AAGI15_11375 [Pseudomonadota bacterium]